jgi:asparagine synthase (glutamine-hydrolysing)
VKDYLVFVPLVQGLVPPTFDALPYTIAENGIHFYTDLEEHFIPGYAGVACARLYAYGEDKQPVFHSLFSQYGLKTFRNLVGDFSYVLLHEGQLLLAKDHLGIRPLFYYQDEEKFIASTSVPLLKSLIKPALNLDYIATELKSFPQKVEKTLFSNIHRVPPAHFGFFDIETKQLQLHRYWELEAESTKACPTNAEKLEELRRRLTEAVRCRAGAVTGCQLSGGMDSSAIAVLLARIQGTDKLHTYSFVLNDKTRPSSPYGVDEQSTQNSVIDYAGLHRDHHHPIEEFHYKSLEEELERTEEVMGGYANSNCLWQDSMFKKAASHGVKVMMSGFPGDEGISTAGTRYFYDSLAQGKYFPFWLQHPLKNSKRILKYFICKWNNTTHPGFGAEMKKRNLLKDSYPAPNDTRVFPFFPSFKQELKEKVTRAHTTLRTESEGNYARTYGIETVYPLADIRLLSWVYSLPSEMFAPVPYTRALFRNVCKGILPEDVRIQPKFNGATTLAFAYYWQDQKDKAFQKIPLHDPYDMVDFQKLQNMKNKREFIRLRLNVQEILYSIARQGTNI